MQMTKNILPVQGIKYLIEEKLLKDTPEDIAMFLYKDTLKLSKVAVGNYLGSQ